MYHEIKPFYEELFITVTDNEDGAQGTQTQEPPAGTQTQEPPVGTQTQTQEPPSAGSQTPDPKKKGKNLEEENKQLKAQLQGSLDQLQNLRKVASMTSDERDKLDKKIETIENELLTEKQRYDREQKKAQQEHEQKLNAEKERADKFENLYKQSTIERALTDAAVENDAFNPKQIVNILDRNTSMEEETVDGVATGKLVPKVSIQIKEGEAVKSVKVSPSEAVKDMLQKDEYMNLFKSNLEAGAGRMNNPSGGSGDGSLSRAEAIKKGTEFYREWKKKNPNK